MKFKQIVAFTLSVMLILSNAGCGTTTNSSESSDGSGDEKVELAESMTDQEFLDSYGNNIGVELEKYAGDEECVLYTIEQFADGDDAYVTILIKDISGTKYRLFGLSLPDDWKEEHFSSCTNYFTKFIHTIEPDLSGEEVVEVKDLILDNEGENVGSYNAIYHYSSGLFVVFAGSSDLSEMLNHNTVDNNSTDETSASDTSDEYGLDTFVGYNSLVSLPDGSPVTVSGLATLVDNGLYKMDIFVYDLDDMDSMNNFEEKTIYISTDYDGGLYDNRFITVKGHTDLSHTIPIVNAEEIEDDSETYVKEGGTFN